MNEIDAFTDRVEKLCKLKLSIRSEVLLVVSMKVRSSGM
jgi:hypothetical protein